MPKYTDTTIRVTNYDLDRTGTEAHTATVYVNGHAIFTGTFCQCGPIAKALHAALPGSFCSWVPGLVDFGRRPMQLAPETIQATRQWFADNARACILAAQRHVETDGQEGWKVNDLAAYVAYWEKAIADGMAGAYDHTFAFRQRAWYIQAGESVALLS